ncbi:YdcH family protein [Paracoccus benzoatiresistens]|uniref:YdcH family protein n=1 Tax=Paracoccus benzoatiresistens TaxID=2997341 RepID=A0ABT4J6L1_9RHOB|nr:YdcH family protein [Paracoccus sp. EF6]MCZ0962752.1 YdcH family protein [Paracoccus sp. EF6]
MKSSARIRLFSASARLAALRRRHQVIKALIAEELRRPMPCSMMLQRLKRQRLAVKDQITRFDGLLRSIGSPDPQRQSA